MRSSPGGCMRRLAVGAVHHELFSTVFPANRENGREFTPAKDGRTAKTAVSPASLGGVASQQALSEQGILRAGNREISRRNREFLGTRRRADPASPVVSRWCKEQWHGPAPARQPAIHPGLERDLPELENLSHPVMTEMFQFRVGELGSESCQSLRYGCLDSAAEGRRAWRQNMACRGGLALRVCAPVYRREPRTAF